MQSCWLQQQDSSSCILFLSGWGMDPEPFRSVPAVDNDLLIAYDYRQVDAAAIMEQVKKYKSLHLVAWSMGVWITGKFFNKYIDRFDSAIALNGTLTPRDEKCGIPPEIFDGMITDFSQATLEQFYRDMFDQEEQVDRFLANKPVRTQQSILSELQLLQKITGQLGPADDIFTHRVIGSRDRIFPARSQLRCWGKENSERVKAAHFPFYDWSSWDMIINREYQDQ